MALTFIESRKLGDVQRVKASYSVGRGLALNTQEHALTRQLQKRCIHRNPYDSEYTINVTAPQGDDFFNTVVSAHCKNKLLVYFTKPQVYKMFVDKCNRLGFKTELTRGTDAYFNYYTVDSVNLCQIIVDVTLL